MCKVSMEAARVWGAFPQRKWGAGLSVSITERYGSRVDYMELVELAVTELVKQRYMLEEDIENSIEESERFWEYLLTRGYRSTPSTECHWLYGRASTWWRRVSGQWGGPRFVASTHHTWVG